MDLGEYDVSSDVMDDSFQRDTRDESLVLVIRMPYEDVFNMLGLFSLYSRLDIKNYQAPALIKDEEIKHFLFILIM